MNPDLLPVLHLRRQAAIHGWRRVSTSPTRHGRTVRYERDDGLDGGWAHVKPGWHLGPLDGWTPLRVSVNTPDGFLVAEHVTEIQAVRLVRTLLGWSADEDVPWPPKSQALVKAGGAS